MVFGRFPNNSRRMSNKTAIFHPAIGKVYLVEGGAIKGIKVKKTQGDPVIDMLRTAMSEARQGHGKACVQAIENSLDFACEAFGIDRWYHS